MAWAMVFAVSYFQMTAVRAHGVNGVGACQGIDVITAAHWKSLAETLARVSPDLAGQDINWSMWAEAWLPMAQSLLQDPQAHLLDCPEGTLAVMLHALPALDRDMGDAVTLEVLKNFHHALKNAGMDAMGSAGSAGSVDSEASPVWRDHWMLAAASAFHFMYGKLVHVPQYEEASLLSPLEVAVPPSRPAALRTYHEFLFQNTVDEFLRSGVLGIELSENSVFFSEALAFFAFCRLQGVTRILESGVYLGFSTEVWSHLARTVVGIDVFVRPEAEERLAQRRNVRLLQGEGRELLPALLDEAPSERTAIFLDGPKGELAIRFALQLSSRPQVAFVAVHDMMPYRHSVLELGAFFLTDEPWFQEAYGHLDTALVMNGREDIGTMAFFDGHKT
eukprot:NODE_459_length_1546_cov_848.672032.p1 GENE.NODE_459_length_1546_cov_848.672032~~NODE_459_length_1546_cov_848.672032.p1  ORF type:complete len:456 (+),score=80.99 NODE_459_length_1546_cov_848.672032:197-1369(+)